jgi:protocatechuate 3,4-dioxygenase, beta subunit
MNSSTTRRMALKFLSASALAACAAAVDPDEQGALAATPSEIEGPFFPENTNVESDIDLTRLAGRSQRAAGQVIEVRGRVLGADGRPLAGARVQLWQANAGGRYAHSRDATNTVPLDPNFQGYGVVQTGADGGFRFMTIKPGGYFVPGVNQTRTPHLHWKFAADGRELTTQSYFPNEPANETDFVVRAMRGDVRQLIADAGATGAEGATGFDWTVVLT